MFKTISEKVIVYDSDQPVSSAPKDSYLSPAASLCGLFCNNAYIGLVRPHPPVFSQPIKKRGSHLRCILPGNMPAVEEDKQEEEEVEEERGVGEMNSRL